jgi:hypothetical protein
MADNYLQFSETLDALTPPEADWLREQLAEDPATDCPRFLADFPDREADDCDCGFQYEFEDSSNGLSLWLSAEERGDVLRVAHLVREFLRRFRPTLCWSLTYATTCSTIRPGEFGGGAVFVTADEIRSHDCYGLIEDSRHAFERRQHELRLVQKAEALKLAPGQLDDAVHEAAASIAAIMNNDGLDGQIAYLVEQLGAEEAERLLDRLRDAADDA